MQDIHRIYHNDYGIAFQWKKDIKKGNVDTIQIVFRNTGFYLNYKEIQDFYNKIKAAQYIQKCKGCTSQHKCASYLLQTPSEKVDLAVTSDELNQIKDLIKGTLFQIELLGYINEICRN